MRRAGKRLAVICYALFVVVVAAAEAWLAWQTASSGALFAKPITMTGEADVCDLNAIYAVGALNRDRIANPAKNIDVYDPFLVTQRVERCMAPWHPLEVYSIQYPPLLFLFATPIAYFSLPDAWKLVAGFSYVCLIGSFLMLAAGNVNSRLERSLGVMSCLASFPATHLIFQGQTTGFELLFLTAAFLLLRAKKFFGAGTFSALALLKLQFFPIAFVPGICFGGVRFLCGFLAMAAFEGALTTVVVGPQSVLNFLRTNYLCEIAHVYSGLNDVPTMMNIRGILAVLFPNSPLVTVVSFTLYGVACLLLAYLWIKARALSTSKNMAFQLLVCFSVSLLLAFSLHAYLYDYVLLIISCTWLYAWSTTSDCADESKLKIVARYAVICTVLIPLIYSAPLDFSTRVMLQKSSFAIYSLFLAAIAALALRAEWRWMLREDAAGVVQC